MGGLCAPSCNENPVGENGALCNPTKTLFNTIDQFTMHNNLPHCKSFITPNRCFHLMKVNVDLQ